MVYLNPDLCMRKFSWWGSSPDLGAGTWDFTLKELTHKLGFSPNEAMLPLTGPERTGSCPSFNPKFTNVHLYNPLIFLYFLNALGASNNGSGQAPSQP